MHPAAPHLERALALRRKEFSDDDPLVAQSRVDHALCLLYTSRLDDAERTIRAALPTLQRRKAWRRPFLALYI
jgi:hypothetical protein